MTTPSNVPRLPNEILGRVAFFVKKLSDEPPRRSRVEEPAVQALMSLALSNHALSAFGRQLKWETVEANDWTPSLFAHIYTHPTLQPLVKHLICTTRPAITRMTTLSLVCMHNLTRLAVDPHEGAEPLHVPRVVTDALIHLQHLSHLEFKYFEGFEDRHLDVKRAVPGLRKLVLGDRWSQWTGDDRQLSQLELFQGAFVLWFEHMLPLESGGLSVMSRLKLVDIDKLNEANRIPPVSYSQLGTLRSAVLANPTLPLRRLSLGAVHLLENIGQTIEMLKIFARLPYLRVLTLAKEEGRGLSSGLAPAGPWSGLAMPQVEELSLKLLWQGSGARPTIPFAAMLSSFPNLHTFTFASHDNVEDLSPASVETKAELTDLLEVVRTQTTIRTVRFRRRWQGKTVVICRRDDDAEGGFTRELYHVIR